MIHHLSLKKKTNLADLKSDIDKLDIDKSKNKPTNFSNLKSNVHTLDVDKLVPTPVDLNKLSYEVKKDAAKNTEYKELSEKVNNISTTDTSNLV